MAVAPAPDRALASVEACFIARRGLENEEEPRYKKSVGRLFQGLRALWLQVDLTSQILHASRVVNDCPTGKHNVESKVVQF